MWRPADDRIKLSYLRWRMRSIRGKIESAQTFLDGLDRRKWGYLATDAELELQRLETKRDRISNSIWKISIKEY